MLDVKKLLTKILDNFGGLKMKTVTIPNVTIAAGTPSAPTLYEHNFANEGITGGIWAIFVSLNSWTLPYMLANGTATWVRNVTGTTLTISNTSSAWNNYTLYALILYK